MGLTVLDAGVVIALFDRSDLHHSAAFEAIEHARARGDQLALPASALAECLVGPARNDAVEDALDFIAAFPIEVVPADAVVAAAAARLRARSPRLRLPDALVLATAQTVSADLLLTTDRGWPDRRTLGLPANVVEL